MISIYALLDPVTLEIRYIGKTKQKPHQRLCGHLKDKTKCHRTRWISGLTAKPVVQVIEQCQEDDWVSRERFWIKHYRDAGVNLTNETSGGDGPAQYDDHIRKKISAANKGKKRPCTPERAAAISAGKKGRGNGLFGRKWTDEARANLSAALMGRISPQKGVRQSPEHIKKRVASKVAKQNLKSQFLIGSL